MVSHGWISPHVHRTTFSHDLIPPAHSLSSTSSASSQLPCDLSDAPPPPDRAGSSQTLCTVAAVLRAAAVERGRMVVGTSATPRSASAAPSRRSNMNESKSPAQHKQSTRSADQQRHGEAISASSACSEKACANGGPHDKERTEQRRGQRGGEIVHLAAEAVGPIRGLLLADIFRVLQVGIKRPAVPDTVGE